MPLAFFGGVYNNYLALAATLERAHALGCADTTWCLGDIGGFGPHPGRSLELLRASGIPVLQGNYDHSLGHGLDDCGCGYTDPRDNRYAEISYRYTQEHTALAARSADLAAPGDRETQNPPLPRFTAPEERVPLGVDLAGRLPGMAVYGARLRRTRLYAHGHSLDPPAAVRPARDQLWRDRPARQRRADGGVLRAV